MAETASVLTRGSEERRCARPATQWPGLRRNQVEATLDTVGLYFRGFAAAATFAEALTELEETLQHRLEHARDRLRLARQRPSDDRRPVAAARTGGMAQRPAGWADRHPVQ